MAWYDMTKEVKAIAKITDNENIKDVTLGLDLHYISDEEIYAWNRSEQNTTINKLEELKRQEIRRETKNNFHWIKEEGEWVVTGSNIGSQKIGSEITVHRTNGETAVKKIIRFSNEGNAIVE